jgi:hypothetical protein
MIDDFAFTFIHSSRKLKVFFSSNLDGTAGINIYKKKFILILIKKVNESWGIRNLVISLKLSTGGYK